MQSGYDLIERAQGGEAIANLASRFGLTQEQASEAVRVMVPHLARGIERNMLTRGGVADLLEALAGGEHARYAEDASALDDPRTLEDGNAILGHILGSPTASRQIAAYGQQETGISSGILRQMLPYLASILMGMLFKSGRGPLGDVLGRLPDIVNSGPSGRNPAPNMPRFPFPMPKEPQQPRRNTDFPELPHSLPQDGTQPYPAPMDRGAFPFPIPGPDTRSPQPPGPAFPVPDSRPPTPTSPQNNPLPDLSDILRGGGQNTGVLSGIIRSIFGGLLGRSSGGGSWFGWIIKLLVLRWGWKLVTGIFRSVLMRR